MKIITPNLCGLIYLAVITISLNVGAAEFTCEVNQRNCLYDTVAAANQTTEPDVIRFSKGIHLTDMKALACAPAIVGDITIIGAGRIDTQLHATNSCAFFHVPKGSSLTLRDIFLANGRKAGPDLVLRGAAVYNEGLLNVERSYFISNTITDNAVFLSGGGAIYNALGATAKLNDVDFADNRVGLQNYAGAAILNEGTMTIARSRFFENTGSWGIIANGVPGGLRVASLVITDSIIEKNFKSTGLRNQAKLLVERTTIRDGDSMSGGGIDNYGNMTVRESAIIRNRAMMGGGVSAGMDAVSIFVNTTISENHARGNVDIHGIGGGIYNYSGDMYLSNSTLASNTAENSGSAIATAAYEDFAAGVYVKNSLILGHSNTPQNQTCYDWGPSEDRKLFLMEKNLLTESNCLPSETDVVVPGTITFTEVIGPLADYGGPTPSHALLPGSPAIDKEGKLCTDFHGMPIVIDQRGNARTGCDKGSVDSTAKVPPVEIKVKLVGSPPGIQPNSTGYIDVAMLSRVDSTHPFRPIVDVDRSSLRLGAAGAAPYKFISQDLNGDKIADLVMRFRVTEIGVICGDKAIELRGTIIGASKFIASTAITTIGCNVN